MSEKRLLAVLGFLLALIGGILVLVAGLTWPRSGNLDLEFVARKVVEIILGIAAILGGLFIYRGRMATGGLLTLLIGVVVIVIEGWFTLSGILIIVGGILGIVGAEARSL